MKKVITIFTGFIIVFEEIMQIILYILYIYKECFFLLLPTVKYQGSHHGLLKYCQSSLLMSKLHILCSSLYHQTVKSTPAPSASKDYFTQKKYVIPQFKDLRRTWVAWNPHAAHEDDNFCSCYWFESLSYASFLPTDVCVPLMAQLVYSNVSAE